MKDWGIEEFGDKINDKRYNSLNYEYVDDSINYSGGALYPEPL